jgi:hypothetical protein
MENVLGGKMGEGKQPHKTRSKRKIIIYQEWAYRFHLSLQTIVAYVKRYGKDGEEPYDPYDILSVLDFNDYLMEIRQGKINKLTGGKG